MCHLLIFDVDGTLCDTSAVDAEATAVEILGAPVGVPDWGEFPSVTDWGIVDALWRRYLGRAPTASEVKAFAGVFLGKLQAALTESPERFRAIAGAEALLGYMMDTGVRFAFATGGWSRSARLKLRGAGLPVERLLASADDSPHRTEIFRLAQERALSSLASASWGEPLNAARDKRGRTPTRTVLIGDGTWDVQVAAELGWAFIGIGQGQREAELTAAGAEVVVPDCSDLERSTVALC